MMYWIYSVYLNYPKSIIVDESEYCWLNGKQCTNSVHPDQMLNFLASVGPNTYVKYGI